MVQVLQVKKILSDEDTKKLEGVKLPVGYYKRVFRKDVDVIDENGNYILRFRKKVLPTRNIEDAYQAMIHHARKVTTTRGVTGGETGKPKLVQHNQPIASNILGYFDTLSLKQKAYFRDANMLKQKPTCRQTAFTMNYPDEWKRVIPLIKDIDRQYKKLFPKQHKIQHKRAQRTDFVIDNTAFSTITTNLNLQTACHYDKGDYTSGFGNLVVIEKGKYAGGFTGFPQYGIAVDVRYGDFLGMDVHRLHGNEPIVPKTKDAERLSLVSYLRDGIYEKCKGDKVLSKEFFDLVKLKANQNRMRNRKTVKKTKKKKTKTQKKRKLRKTKK